MSDDPRSGPTHPEDPTGAETTGHEPVVDATVVPDEATAAEAHAVANGEEPSPVEAAPEPEPDWHDRYLRAAADLDNVRKRARRDVGMAELRGIVRLAKELLPALDNLERAIAAAEAEETDAEHHLTHGIRLVQKELVGSLARVGIEPYDPTGEPFDPHRHEAIAQQPFEGVATGTVAKTWQPGYRLGEDVLRPAKVVVAA
jgi:molecular chaperone GrpE